MQRSKAQLERLIRGATGEIKADLIITGGRVINVYSGEILQGVEIAVLDGRICYVGPNAQHTQGDETEIFDAGALYVSPGFIDGHTHIGHYCRPYEYLQAYVPHGTTALMASADELATVFGYQGVKFFLDEVGAHPLRVYVLISMVAPQDPLLCSTQSLTQDEIAQGLDDSRVLGLGEIVSWLRLLQYDSELLERIEMAQQRGKIVHGHTAGAKDQKLCAISAVGISSCHEPIREEDAIERLRLGYWTMLREGSLRQDLAPTLKPLVKRGVNLQRLILVTDSMSPDDVEVRGHMDHLVRRAISLGLAPVQAIQTVTLNPAIYSGLDQEIGGIAPGRWADFVFLDDLEQCEVHTTLIGGTPVAKNGVSMLESRPVSPPLEMINSLGLRPTVTPDMLAIPWSGPAAKIRIMELINQTITAEKIIRVNSDDDYVRADLHGDLLKVAVFDRHQRSGKISMGFLHGFGAKLGAVGMTTNLDENTLMIVGSNDDDMAQCANTLIECGGGMAIVNQKQLLEKIEFPFGGIFSLLPWKEVAKGLNRVQQRLRDNGSTFDKPLYALSFLTFVTLPSLRITARGLVSAKERRLVPLFVE